MGGRFAMSSSACRKMKALMILAMLAVNEGRRTKRVRDLSDHVKSHRAFSTRGAAGSQASPSMDSDPAAAVDSPMDVLSNDLAFKEQPVAMAGSMDEFALLIKEKAPHGLLARATNMADEIVKRSIGSESSMDSGLAEDVKLNAALHDSLEAASSQQMLMAVMAEVMTDPEFQQTLGRVSETLGSLMQDPELLVQAGSLAADLESMKDSQDPDVVQKVSEKIDAMIASKNLKAKASAVVSEMLSLGSKAGSESAVVDDVIEELKIMRSRKDEDLEDKTLEAEKETHSSFLEERIGHKDHRGRNPWFLRAGLKADPDTIYDTKSDFERADPDQKRLVVVGETGVGKSTFLNIIGGWTYECQPDPKPNDEDNSKNVWTQKGTMDKIFETRFGSKGVQTEAQMAHLKWFGNPDRPFIAVDTVGVMDPATRKVDSKEAQEQVNWVLVDIHDKLQALQKVNVIAVMHSDLTSCRLKQSVSQVLEMLSEKFPEEELVWRHIAIVCTKCNSVDRGWRDSLEERKTEIREGIYKMFPQCKEQLGNDDLPVITVGALTKPGADASEEAGYKELWEFVAKASPMSTRKLKEWSGDHQKYQVQVARANHETDMRKAAELWQWVCVKVGLVLLSLLMRAYWWPAELQWCLLNLAMFGMIDELLIVAVLIFHFIGRQDFINVLGYVYEHKVCTNPQYQQYVDPYVKPILAKLKGLLDEHVTPLCIKAKAD